MSSSVDPATEKNRASQYFLAALAVEALLVISWLLLIPSESGLSTTRLLMIGVSGGIGITALLGVWGFAKSIPWAQRSAEKIAVRLDAHHNRFFWFFLALFAAAAIFFLVVFFTSAPFWQTLFSRLVPMVSWLAIFGLQAIWLLNKLSTQFTNQAKAIQSRATEFLSRAQNQTFLVSKPVAKKFDLWEIALVAILFGILWFLHTSLGQIIIDDAWITFRYSRNLANGFGLTWEPSMPPVEGYSNLLEVAIVALGFRLNLDPATVAQGIGVFSIIGTLAILQRLLRQVTGSRLIAFISLLVLVIHPATAIHVWAGLETILFVFLTAVIALLFYRASHTAENKSLLGLMVLSILISITRTEGVVIGGLTFGLGWLYSKNRWAWVKYGAGFVGTIGLYQLFRHFTFGGLVTGPQIVKFSQDFVLGGLSSVEFLSDLLQYLENTPLGILSVGLLLVVALPVGKNWRKPNPAQQLFILASLQLLALLGVYSRTNMIQNFASRFFYHTAASQILIVGMGIAFFIRALIRFASTPGKRFPATTLLMAPSLIIFTLVAGWIPKYANTLSGLQNFGEAYRSQQESGQALAETLNAHPELDDEWLVTVVDSGIIPFHTHSKTLGGDGLTNVDLAPFTRSLETDGESYSNFIYDINPAVLVIERMRKIITPEHTALACHPAYQNYRAVARFMRDDRLSYEVYLRTDLSKFETIQVNLLAVPPGKDWQVQESDESDPIVEQTILEACP